MKILNLLSILLLFTSCKSQTDNQSAKSIEVVKPQTEEDYYFTGHSVMESEIGPKNITRNIIEDNDKNIWLMTWEGLIKYDGQTFTNITNTESLRRFRFFTGLKDSKGVLWFGTQGAGIYKYDGKEFTNITIKDGLVNDRIGHLYEDSKGKIWISTMGGLSILEGSKFTNFTEENGLINNDLNSIAEDENGKMWIGARGHLSTYDGEKFERFLKENGDPFTNVRRIIKTKNNDIYFGGNDGMWSFDGESQHQHTEKFTGYIYQDSNGNIWTSASTDNVEAAGLYKYNLDNLKQNGYSPTLVKEEQNMFFGILEDSKGRIWNGTLKGVCRYDGEEVECFGGE